MTPHWRRVAYLIVPLAMASPQPPPPAPPEVVPPPPPSTVPLTWRPGHWRWTGVPGREWQWDAGRYVERPPGATSWVVGQWQPAPNGWIWVAGHWQ